MHINPIFSSSVNLTMVGKGNPPPEEKQKEKQENVSNNGWGDLFKNKEHFVEMHHC